MRDTILDDAAIAFTTGFYDGLGYGRNIEDAFELGRNAILWELSSFSDTTRKMIPVDLTETEAETKTEDKTPLPENQKPILLKKSAYIKPQVSANNEVETPNPSETSSENSQEKYRARIQEYLAERNLTPIAKFQLATFARQQGISESEANSILETELAQIEEAKATYKDLLEATIAEGFNPLNPQTQQDLKELQQDLKLTDREVAAISEAVLVKTEVDRTPQGDLAPQTSQPERIVIIQQGNYNESIQGNYYQGNRRESSDLETTTSDLEDNNLEKFSFEVITVNERGEESSRTTKEAKFFSKNLGNGVTLDMVSIPGGEFLMGTEEEEIERLIQKFRWEGFKRERPQHRVKIQPFFMGKYPVTQGQWQAIMGNNPARFQDNLLNPVENVSWNDAEQFCQQLSQHTGTEYRLPSEAEWEYACRVGMSTPFYFGETITGELVNYRASSIYAAEAKGEYRRKTTEVEIFPPNGFGLYDLHGNVWEWCADDWHNNYDGAPQDGSAWLSKNSIIQVIRGGSWGGSPDLCRSAVRSYYDSREYRNNSVGFRVACVAGRTT